MCTIAVHAIGLQTPGPQKGLPTPGPKMVNMFQDKTRNAHDEIGANARDDNKRARHMSETNIRRDRRNKSEEQSNDVKPKAFAKLRKQNKTAEKEHTHKRRIYGLPAQPAPCDVEW